MRDLSVFISYALDNKDDRRLVHKLAQNFEQDSIKV